MDTPSSASIIGTIVSTAADQGLNQKELAKRARLSAEALSRAKKRGSMTLAKATDLAQAAGLAIVVRPASEPAPSPPAKSYRQKYRALMWSNPAAPDAVWIRRALVRPEFDRLLDTALEFGMARLEAEWEVLLQDRDPEALRASSITEPLLRNLRHGYDRARA